MNTLSLLISLFIEMHSEPPIKISRKTDAKSISPQRDGIYGMGSDKHRHQKKATRSCDAAWIGRHCHKLVQNLCTQNVCASSSRRTCSTYCRCSRWRAWILGGSYGKQPALCISGFLSLSILSNKSIPLPKISDFETHGVVDGCMGSTEHWFAEPTRIWANDRHEPYG